MPPISSFHPACPLTAALASRRDRTAALKKFREALAKRSTPFVPVPPLEGIGCASRKTSHNENRPLAVARAPGRERDRRQFTPIKTSLTGTVPLILRNLGTFPLPLSGFGFWTIFRYVPGSFRLYFAVLRKSLTRNNQYVLTSRQGFPPRRLLWLVFSRRRVDRGRKHSTIQFFLFATRRRNAMPSPTPSSSGASRNGDVPRAASKPVPRANPTSAPPNNDEWRTRCPQCQKKIRVPFAYLGKRIRCPRCSHRLKAGLVSGEKQTPPHSSANAGELAQGPSAIPAIAVDAVVLEKVTDRPTFTPIARSDPSGSYAAPRPPDAIPVGRGQPPSAIPVYHAPPTSPPAAVPTQPTTDIVEVEAIATFENVDVTEAAESEVPEPIYYQPLRHSAEDDGSTGVGLSPYTTHLALYVAFRWVIPGLLLLVVAAAMPAGRGSLQSGLGFLGLIAIAFMVLPVIPDHLARRLTAVIGTSFECPGCHEVHEAVSRWGCTCGYQDYRERHFILMRCELCGARPGWSDCRRCGATIFLQKCRLPKDRREE